MSTYCRTTKKISIVDLFDGRLAAYGITEVCEFPGEANSDGQRTLTDGESFLVVYGDEHVEHLVRRTFSWPSPECIIEAIEEAFDTDIFSEYQPQYWGFETQEEWDKAMEEMENQDRDRFYDDAKKYIAGEPNGIREGTIGQTKASIAVMLIEQQPELALPGAKDDFLRLVDEAFDRDHTIKVTLDESDIAFARLLATPSAYLPRS